MRAAISLVQGILEQFVFGRIGSSGFHPFVQTGFVDLCQEAAFPGLICSTDSEGISRRLTSKNESNSLSVSAVEVTKRILEVIAGRYDLLLQLKDDKVS